MLKKENVLRQINLLEVSKNNQYSEFAKKIVSVINDFDIFNPEPVDEIVSLHSYNIDNETMSLTYKIKSEPERNSETKRLKDAIVDRLEDGITVYLNKYEGAGAEYLLEVKFTV